MSATRRQVRIGALCAAALLVFAACGGDDDDDCRSRRTHTTRPTKLMHPRPKQRATSRRSRRPRAVTNEWALAYTGGTEGPADESLEPVVIGYVNQEGGVPAFPEATIGLDAAVAVRQH